MLTHTEKIARQNICIENRVKGWWECSRQLEFHNNSNPETNPLLLSEKNQAQNTCSSDFPVRRDMIFVSFTLWYIISLTCKPTSMACNPKPRSYSQSSWLKALKGIAQCQRKHSSARADKPLSIHSFHKKGRGRERHTEPPAPPNGWWIMTRAFGMQYRFPFEPAASKKAPIEAARPKQTVDTSALQSFIAS
jgi:hypothetical protein